MPRPTRLAGVRVGVVAALACVALARPLFAQQTIDVRAAVRAAVEQDVRASDRPPVIASPSTPAEVQARVRPVPVARAGRASFLATWEIEGHAGFEPWDVSRGVGPPLSTGSSLLLTPVATSESVRVASWFFGDGAALLSEAQTNISSFVMPLDPALRSPALSARGVTGGFSVRRRLTPRLAAEIRLDAGLARANIGSESRAGVAATVATYGPAFSGLFDSAPSVFNGASVTAASAFENGSRPFQLTGAITLNLAPRGRIRPFLTLGAGVTTLMGPAPSVTLVGHYAFAFVPSSLFNAASSTGAPVPIDETDRITLHVGDERVRPVGVLGMGFARDVSARTALRFEVRAVVGADSTVTLDAEPSHIAGPTTGTVTYGRVPALQFSTSPAFQSSLSVPVSGSRTFDGAGLRYQIGLTVGYVVRFGVDSAAESLPASSAPAVTHRFFDGRNIALTVLESAALLADGATTRVEQRENPAPDADPLARWFVSHGWRGQMFGGGLLVSGEVASRYLLHRRGHHQVERFLPFMLALSEAVVVLTNAADIHDFHQFTSGRAGAIHP